MTLTREIAARHGAARVDRCNERCLLRTGGGPRTVILKGELLAGTDGQKMCDCLIFRDDMRVAMVELKSRHLDPKAIREKLLNGGLEALRLVAEATGGKGADLFFVVLAKSYKDRTAQRRIRQIRIKIGNKKHPVGVGECRSHISCFVGSAA